MMPMNVSKCQDERQSQPLDVLIIIHGTRGDAQPYIRIAQILQDTFGHRVRLAGPPSSERLLHDEHGLEYRSTGHDLTSFLKFDHRNFASKLRGFINGDVSQLKQLQAEIFDAHWYACVDKGNKNERPFVADAIISSPVVFSSISLAQRLGVPLFLLHANPRSPTRAWPHSAVNPTDTILQDCDKNFKSWASEESKLWKFHYRPITNSFRARKLGLGPLSRKFWPTQFDALGVPLYFLVSPKVLPKPDDWLPEHNMIGYSFASPPANFEPPQTLLKFLSEGGPIVYVDFGSNVYPNPRHLTSMVMEAVETLGIRAIIHRAWFATETNSSGIFVTDDLPHSWLIPRVDLVVHACGAGMTAITLHSGKPSVAVPVRGDQYLWAKRLEQLQAAPKVLYAVNLDQLSFNTAIKEALQPKYRLASERMAKALVNDTDGATVAMDLWHEYMRKSNGYPLACSIISAGLAVWIVRDRKSIALSGLVAHILHREGCLNYVDLDLICRKDWEPCKVLRRSSASIDLQKDVVRQARMAQGAFDFEKAAEESFILNGLPHGKDSGGGNRHTTRDALIRQVVASWQSVFKHNA